MDTSRALFNIRIWFFGIVFVEVVSLKEIIVNPKYGTVGR